MGGRKEGEGPAWGPGRWGTGAIEDQDRGEGAGRRGQGRLGDQYEHWCTCVFWSLNCFEEDWSAFCTLSLSLGWSDVFL